jgi:small-conductance mechanosensitive channel
MEAFLQDLLSFLPQPWRSLAIPLIVFAVVLAVGMAIRRFAFAKVRKWARETPTRFDGSLIETLHGPVLLWVVMFAIFVATDTSRLPPRAAERAEETLRVLWILSLTIAVSRLAGRAVRHYGNAKTGGHQMGTLAQVFASIVIGVVGVLMIMNALGVNITALLTALGVGGLAVALALQDTLSNFFAGFYISIAGQIRVGDLIRLDSGQQGYVTDIGWRCTTLRQGENNLVVIPNNKLGQSIVTNYDLPESRVSSSIRVSVAPTSDPSRVETLVLDVVRSADIKGLLRHPAPSVTLNPGFGERGFDFTATFSVVDFESQDLVQHELRKLIVARFREANIKLAFAPRMIEPPPQ